MSTSTFRSVLLGLVPALTLCVPTLSHALVGQERAAAAAQEAEEEETIEVYYLEIVTPEMDETCALLEALHGVTFGEPQAALGNARTAKMKGGGRLGVRKPMHEAETPVVRPYVQVEDIAAAFEAVQATDAQVLLPPRDSEEGGQYSIFDLGGIHHGIWQP